MDMKKSTFENPLPEQYHAIAATGYRGNGAEVEGKWPIYPEMAAAGLWTTPTQLIQYAIEIQKINNSKKDGILEYKSVKEMLKGGMNGRALATEARHRHPDLPLLYMSGYTEDAIAHRGRLDVDANLLQKPFRRNDLARAVRQALTAPVGSG